MPDVWAPRCEIKRQKQQQLGFTMAELLVTMLLLTVVVIGLATLQAQTIRSTRFNNKGAQALRLTQSVIEQYQVMTYSQLVATDWVLQPRRDGAPGGMSGVGVDGESQGPFTVQYKIEAFQSGLLLTVETAWVDKDPLYGSLIARYANPVQRVSLSVLRYP